MRAVTAALILCAGILPASVEANAHSIPKEVASRVEIYVISSLTISDQQFLTGDANGKAVTVAGEFRIAQGAGRLPVVMLMHGSSGVGASSRGGQAALYAGLDRFHKLWNKSGAQFAA